MRGKVRPTFTSNRRRQLQLPRLARLPRLPQRSHRRLPRHQAQPQRLLLPQELHQDLAQLHIRVRCHASQQWKITCSGGR
jgi:hypothetical protein